MPLIRSISGLRGTIGDGLTPEVVVQYVSAFAGFTGGGAVVVGSDGRPSGEWIEEIVTATLRAAGVEARMIGIAPTPTVQLATEHSDAAGGISITASHNPSEWNGLKFLDRDGIFLDADACRKLFAMVDAPERSYAGWDGAGLLLRHDDAIVKHCDRALGLPFVDGSALRERAFHVVVDAVNASGSVIVPMLLERCGCRVTKLYCDGSGRFPHTPEPIPENLTALAAAVTEHGADIGVAVDPDADRLVLIDERGTPFGEEYTITQAVDFMLRRERRAHLEGELIAVVNLSTTRAVDDVAARYAARVERTPVGEINVARRMKEIGAVIGGEGSGGVIVPALHYGRDSIAGIVILLANLLEHGGTLSALRASLPAYEIVKRKAVLAAGAAPAAVLERIAGLPHDGARIRTDDGVKLDFEHAWVHLRASNTEPIVRVIAEARTREEAATLADTYLASVQAAV